jgi:cytochrome c-type biogenesis protein CcmH/NrfG
MAKKSSPEVSQDPPGLLAQQVYLLAAICLLVGLVVGFLLPGGRTATATKPGGPNEVAGAKTSAHPPLTMEQMKQLADVQAGTLIEKSKAEPKNSALLNQIAAIYQAAHQFKDAAGYFDKALKIDPKNVAARTQLASCLYYSGDVDGALSQLDLALKYNPKDVNSLFNLGMIRYQGKNDSAGAIAAWEQLLRTNPNLDRRPIVEQMIADAKSKTARKN